MKKILIATIFSLTLASCATEEARRNWLIAGAVIGGAALAYQAGKGGGYSPPASDYQWDWDQFYNQHYQLVWACRGVQTAQFAEEWHCSGLPQTDWRWPAK